MGLILGPIILFWFLMAIYSLKIGYSLLNEFSLFPSIFAIFMIGIISFFAYVYLGLQSFKDSTELWWADIPMFFTTNKYILMVFITTMLVHWFGNDYIKFEYAKPVIFIIVFTISLGALAGTFSSESFMNKHNIARTH